MKTLIKILCLSVLCFSCGYGSIKEPNDYHTIMYFGLGIPDHSNPNKSDATPMSFGITGYLKDIKTYMGIEIGWEGTMLSSTYGRNNAIEQGFSYNFIFSKPLYIPIEYHSTLGLIIGLRDIRQYCPGGDSYLGYACYADEIPSSDTELSLGALFTISQEESLVFGLRITTVSTQATVGINF
jgi:hypothetical protein